MTARLHFNNAMSPSLDSPTGVWQSQNSYDTDRGDDSLLIKCLFDLSKAGNSKISSVMNLLCNPGLMKCMRA